MARQPCSGDRQAPRMLPIRLNSNSPSAPAAARVLGRLVTNRGIKNSAIINVLRAAWSRYGSVRMTELDERTIAFEFASVGDMNLILDMAPWSIHGHSLNLKECPIIRCADEVDFNTMQMWVQVHGLSLDMFNPGNAISIGDTLGNV